MSEAAERGKNKKHPVRNGILIGIAVLIVAFVAYKLIYGYVSALPKFDYVYSDYASGDMVRYPDASFAVITDTHYYDTSLGIDGAAYEAVLNSDRKLLEESDQLLKTAVDEILNAAVDFVLVCGDQTKDGEYINHQNAAAELQRLVDSGIKVYVTPGNHDVLNPDAVAFEGDTTYPADSVTPAEFAEIYNNCGYGDAILRDPDSLSYVAEPQDGLWIVSVDTCEYYKNEADSDEMVGGELQQSVVDWLETVFVQANEQDKAVILMEHHGVVEHWDGQAKLHPDYLLSDYTYVNQFYSSYGVRLAFTGHYHAQDIALSDNGELGFIYDIESGSLITPPCPMRYCKIADNSITIRSSYILSTLGTQAAAEALVFVEHTLYEEAYNTLKKYFVSDSGADYIADLVAQAFLAHYNGNEDAANRIEMDTGRLSLWIDSYIHNTAMS